MTRYGSRPPPARRVTSHADADQGVRRCGGRGRHRGHLGQCDGQRGDRRPIRRRRWRCGRRPAGSRCCWNPGRPDGSGGVGFGVGCPGGDDDRVGVGVVLAASGGVGGRRPGGRVGGAGRLLPGRGGAQRRDGPAGDGAQGRPAGRRAAGGVDAGPRQSRCCCCPGSGRTPRLRALASCGRRLGLELRALEATGQDVIVDAGRLGMVSSPHAAAWSRPIWRCWWLRSDLPSLAAARQWAAAWGSARDDGTGAAAAGVVLVGEGRPYIAGEVSRVLQIPVVEKVAWDERTAQVFSVGQQPTAKFGHQQARPQLSGVGRGDRWGGCRRPGRTRHLEVGGS